MPFHHEGAYDGFDGIYEAKQHYRRCRTLKSFILSKSGVEKDKPVCAVCGESLEKPPKKHPDSDAISNRCEYHPRLKKVAVMHYICAWESLLNKVFTVADRLF